MTEKRIVQRGLYYEEFELGVTYVHSPSRTARASSIKLQISASAHTSSERGANGTTSTSAAA